MAFSVDTRAAQFEVATARHGVVTFSARRALWREKLMWRLVPKPFEAEPTAFAALVARVSTVRVDDTDVAQTDDPQRLPVLELTDAELADFAREFVELAFPKASGVGEWDPVAALHRAWVDEDANSPLRKFRNNALGEKLDMLGQSRLRTDEKFTVLGRMFEQVKGLPPDRTESQFSRAAAAAAKAISTDDAHIRAVAQPVQHVGLSAIAAETSVRLAEHEQRARTAHAAERTADATSAVRDALERANTIHEQLIDLTRAVRDEQVAASDVFAEMLITQQAQVDLLRKQENENRRATSRNLYVALIGILVAALIPVGIEIWKSRTDRTEELLDRIEQHLAPKRK